jgi:hypothetical protein
MGIKVPLTVEMDDGRTLKVVIDQRDYAAVEAQEIEPMTQRNLWSRYLAFNGLKRTKQYGGTWEQFNTVDCVEAISDAPEAPDGDESLDPGRAAPTGGA